jgi:DNA-binding NarL/FixJ family response regulator
MTDHDNQALRQAALAAGARRYFLKENLFEMRSELQAVTE